VLHGLVPVLFGQWFVCRNKQLHLYGTSTGSLKSVAAARHNPGNGFDNLARAYIHTCCQSRITPDQVAIEADRILNEFLRPGVAQEVLNHLQKSRFDLAIFADRI